jgi:hypothetical protein
LIQANKIQELADNLRICTFQEETGIFIDADAQYIVLNDHDGNEFWPIRSFWAWMAKGICVRGKQDFYDYIQKILATEP